MKRPGIVLILCILIFNGFAQTGDYIYHEVKAGETKYGIAKEYGVSIEELEKYNPEIRAGLKENYLLLIPKKTGKPENAVKQQEKKTHKVLQGETVYSISHRYNVSMQQLKEANPALADGLKAGMELTIPDQVQEKKDQPIRDPDFIHHTVKDGETLYSLAREYGVSVMEIREANPEIETISLRLNSTIKIPRPRQKVSRVAEPASMIDTLYYYHQVTRSETAYSISKRYRLSLDSLFLLNPGAENGLQIGQHLKLPASRNPERKAEVKPEEELNSDIQSATAATGDTSNGFFLYQIKGGDSFYSLKSRFYVTREELIRFNPEIATGLIADKYIIIPIKEPVEKRDVTWLEKLFGEEQQVESVKGNPRENQVKRKDSLNNPSDITGTKPIREDTLKIDVHKNYRVAVMLPFNAVDDSLQGSIGDVSRLALDFYNGFLLAADTLSKQGMNITLNVIDTKNSVSLLQSKMPSIRSARYDLIIGPLFQKNVEYVADMLKIDSIPVVSPMSKTVDVTNRPNLIKCIPGEGATAQEIANLINKKHKDSRIVFASSVNAEDRELVRQIKARLMPRDNGAFIDNVVFTDEEMLKRNQISEILAEDKPNLVVVISEDPVFLSDLVSKLRLMRSRNVTLVGPSKLLQIPTLELGYLNSLSLTMPDASFVDYEDAAVNAFVKEYRNLYSNDPSRFAFQGYDVGMYFLQKLRITGPYLLRALGDSKSYLSTGFQMEQVPGGGYENEFLFMTGVKDFTLVRKERD